MARQGLRASRATHWLPSNGLGPLRLLTAGKGEGCTGLREEGVDEGPQGEDEEEGMGGLGEGDGDGLAELGEGDVPGQ